MMWGVAQSGQAALNFLDKSEPDLILLDIMMPDFDGFEVCRKIKSDIALKHIPIIFLTARTDSEDIVKGFEMGGADYVTKPFNATELLARIKTHIEMKVLRGLLPMCSKCKRIRDDKGFWQQVDAYIEAHSEAVFSHGICPDCLQDMYGEKEWFHKRR